MSPLISPENRRERLLELTTRWPKVDRSHAVLKMEPERGLVTFKARLLKQEEMIFGENRPE